LDIGSIQNIKVFMLCTKEKNKPMKSNELRIGNWITWKSTGKIEMVEKVDVYGLHVCVNDVNIEDALPIPLTEEWLIRFGFEADHNDYFFECEEHGVELEASWSSRNQKTGESYGWHISEYKHVKHIHQLQNLYFALTGEELETK
jgi:hypothetical protein